MGRMGRAAGGSGRGDVGGLLQNAVALRGICFVSAVGSRLSFEGCGVPEARLVPRLGCRTVGPIQFYSCFISYSTKDHDFAPAALRADAEP